MPNIVHSFLLPCYLFDCRFAYSRHNSLLSADNNLIRLERSPFELVISIAERHCYCHMQFHRCNYWTVQVCKYFVDISIENYYLSMIAFMFTNPICLCKLFVKYYYFICVNLFTNTQLAHTWTITTPPCISATDLPEHNTGENNNYFPPNPLTMSRVIAQSLRDTYERNISFSGEHFSIFFLLLIRSRCIICDKRTREGLSVLAYGTPRIQCIFMGSGAQIY